MPEWLSGKTRNLVGSARAGSNPAEHVFLRLVSHTLTWFKGVLAYSYVFWWGVSVRGLSVNP